MAKTRPQQGQQAARQPMPAAPLPKQTAKQSLPFWERPRIHTWVALAIAVFTFLCYRVALDNQMTNWDDPGYIRDNAVIKSLSAEGLAAIFTTPIMGNYHPLTILSYALEYGAVRLDPWLYHLDSILLHVLVTVLVYFFTRQLTRMPVAAVITAVLFGVHPMHVESVAWLAGRKDVLYGSFYLAACITYLRYARSGAGKWLIYTYVAFLCALLAKPVAVTLPLVLLLIDYYESGTWSKKNILNKIPFLLISVVFGIKSMIDQKAFGSLSSDGESFASFERIALGGYAFVTYLWKAIAPYNLSCFYPYPPRPNGAIEGTYYIFPLITLGILGLVWWFRTNKTILFGALFFLVNIALLLQFIPVGGAIIADRYSYIPYMGLFLMLGVAIASMLNNPALVARAKIIVGALAVWVLYLGSLTSARCSDWYDTMSLWRDQIEKQPGAPNAYNNLGFQYFNKFNETPQENLRRIYYDSAFYLLNQSLAIDPKFVNSIVSLGELQRASGKFNEARAYYYQALSLNDKDGAANAYLGLAIIYAISQNLDSSAICFRKAIENKPFFPELHSNFGNFYDMSHMPDSALKEYGIAIAQNPDAYAPYLNRARLLHRLKRCTEAMQDFEAAAQLHPEDGEVYYSRAFCHNGSGNKAAALQDVERARELGFRQINPEFYNMLKSGR